MIRLHELDRIREAVGQLRVSVDDLLAAESLDKDQKQVLEAYRMFAHSRGWLRRMEEDIEAGLSAEAAVAKEQSTARARLEQCARCLSARTPA
jgi:phosphotransferase system, enzyme I, PtsP